MESAKQSQTKISINASNNQNSEMLERVYCQKKNTSFLYKTKVNSLDERQSIYIMERVYEITNKDEKNIAKIQNRFSF